MTISSVMVKELREKTGAGMMDCKKALTETSGDMDKAIDIMRERGIAKAAKRADKAANMGLIESYIHMNGNIGVLLQLNCETDFVARTDDFKALAKDISMHIAAASPLYISNDEIPADVLEKEKEVLKAQVLNEGKPANIVDKIVDGKITKFCSEVCLLEQSFVKDPDKKISDIISEAIAKIGENISIGKFARFELGA